MIARQGGFGRPFAAVHAHVAVAGEQSLVAERRHVLRALAVRGKGVAPRRDDGIDLYDGTRAADGVGAAAHSVHDLPARVQDLAEMIQPHRLLVTDPVQRHSGHIRAQSTLIEVVHRLFPAR